MDTSHIFIGIVQNCLSNIIIATYNKKEKFLRIEVDTTNVSINACLRMPLTKAMDLVSRFPDIKFSIR